MNATLKSPSVTTELVGCAVVLGRSGESSVQATSDVAQIEIQTSRNREANKILVAPRLRTVQALDFQQTEYRIGRSCS